jgi:hypothetical protein
MYTQKSKCLGFPFKTLPSRPPNTYLDRRMTAFEIEVFVLLILPGKINRPLTSKTLLLSFVN